jgi:pimeloyl-ACP methyl ester carboxylesterase
MDSILAFFGWIAEHEALLSGLAASAAMAGVMTTLSLRMVASTGERLRRTARAQDSAESQQQIRYCATRDGVRIAYARTGRDTGAVPLVRALGWFTHLEAEWAHVEGRALWQRLSRSHPLYRYDGRSMGLSSRVTSRFTLEERVRDLEAVVDAAGLECFALIGLSEGGCAALAYAERHPERVSHLVLINCFLSPNTFDGVTRERWAHMLPLLRSQWGAERPATRQLFTSVMIPDANAEQNRYFNEMQRLACDGPTAFHAALATATLDVTDIAARVTTPTLVMHRKADLAVPVEAGHALAARLPNAELVLLEGANHWMLMKEDDTDEIVSRIEEFLRKHPNAATG